MFSHPWINKPHVELVGLAEKSARIASLLRPAWRYAWDRRLDASGNPLWVSSGELAGRTAVGPGGAANPTILGDGLPGYSTDGFDYFTLSNHGDFGYPVCLSFWWFSPSVGGQSILLSVNAVGRKFTLESYVVAGTRYLFTDSVLGASLITIAGHEIHPFDAWFHICFQTDATNWYYYLNGILTKSGVFPFPLIITPSAATIFRSPLENS